MKKLIFTAFFAVCAVFVYAQTFTYNGKTLAENETFTKQTSPGKTSKDDTPEVSGLAASRRTTGYFWANCDDPTATGENGYIYALNPNGSVRMKLKTGITAKYSGDNKAWDKQDWEDICMATRKEGGVDKHYIIVGGFGDNKLDKGGVYYLYIIPEPEITSGTATATGVITLTFSFPGSRKSNNEAVMYDPVSDQIIVITKETSSSKVPTGNPSRVYKAPFSTSSKTVTFTAVKDASSNDLTLGKGKSENKFYAVSAADMSMDGKYALVMCAQNTENSGTQASVLYWERTCATEPFDEMISRAPEYVTAYSKSDDFKGEAIAWSLDGKSFITCSDDDAQDRPINKYSRSSVPTIAASCTAPVVPVKVTKPTLLTNTFTYTGSAISVQLKPENTELYSITSGGSATAVNTYTAKVALQDKINYMWDDGSTTDLSLEWRITEVPVTPIPGCTDNTAINYNPLATEDNGSCTYDITPPTLTAIPPTGTPASGNYWINDDFNDKSGSGPFNMEPENICVKGSSSSSTNVEEVESNSCPDDEGYSDVLRLHNGASKASFTVPNAKDIVITLGAKVSEKNITSVKVSLSGGASTNKTVSGLWQEACGTATFNNINSATPVTVTIETAKAGETFLVLDIQVTKYNPTMTVSKEIITGLGYEIGNTSEVKSFTVQGAQLANAINVSLPAGSKYEISKSSSSGYTQSVSFSPSSKTVSSSTVYVRLKTGQTANNYEDEISVSTVYNKKGAACDAATTETYTKYVVIGGTVSAAVIPPALAVTVNNPEYEYSASAIVPDITIKNGEGTILTEGVDYTVSYSDNTNAGTVTITVTGKAGSEYAGLSDNSKTFTITPKSVAVVWENTVLTYTGSVQKPKAKITGVGGDGTINLCVHGEKTNAGTYQAEAEFCSTNNNYTLINTTQEFIINAIAGSNNLVANAIPNQEYSGSDIEPNVTVKYNGKTLTEGSDYTIAYSENKNAGTATVTITGIGNYAGSNGVATFIINKKKIAKPTLPTNTFVYDGTEKSVAPATNPVYTIGGTLSATNVRDDYEVTVTLNDKNNYRWADGSDEDLLLSWSITPRIITVDVTLAASETGTYIYKGTAHTPAVIVKNGNTELLKDIDYTVSYNKNINAGTNTAEIIIEGTGNYAGCSGILNFSIGKAPLTVTAKPKTITFATNPATVDFSARWYDIDGFVNGENYASLSTNPTVTIHSSITSTSPVAEYPNMVLVEGGSAANYEFVAYIPNMLTINKATIAFPAITVDERDYEEDLTLGDIELPDGYEWKNPETPLNAGENTDFEVIYTKDENHNPVEGKVTVVVNPNLNTNTGIDAITVDGVEAQRNGNDFYVLAACGAHEVTVVITAATQTTVAINGIEGASQKVALPNYGNTALPLTVTAENGDVATCTLIIEKRIPANIAFFNRFENVLTVPAHIEGLHELATSASWYVNGNLHSRNESKRYIEMIEAGTYYAIINDNYRTCDVYSQGSSALAMTVYPNPVIGGAPVTVEINRTNEELQGAILQIFTTHGQLLHTQTGVGSTTAFNAPNKTSNYLIFKLVSPAGNKEIKVIIK